MLSLVFMEQSRCQQQAAGEGMKWDGEGKTGQGDMMLTCASCPKSSAHAFAVLSRPSETRANMTSTALNWGCRDVSHQTISLFCCLQRFLPGSWHQYPGSTLARTTMLPLGSFPCRLLHPPLTAISFFSKKIIMMPA